VTMAAGLRAMAKAAEHPPEPKVGAPVLDPTDESTQSASTARTPTPRAIHKIDHSISSACICSDCGIVRPIAFAVLRLMTRSSFVGCSIARSPGLAPLRMRST